MLTRFRVAEDDVAQFVREAHAAMALLEDKHGLVWLDFARNIDDRELWTLTTRWRDVGSYRRALSGVESKMTLTPLMMRAIDEPSAYEDPDLLDPIEYRGGADL